MKALKITLFLLFFSMPLLINAEEKEKIPKQDKWEQKNDRDFSSPQLYRDNSFVYVYSEKQLDNLTIGITDMQGNTYHYEVTTVPSCTYYAISIESLPAGQYYFCIYQGSNYTIGLFTKS